MNRLQGPGLVQTATGEVTDTIMELFANLPLELKCEVSVAMLRQTDESLQREIEQRQKHTAELEAETKTLFGMRQDIGNYLNQYGQGMAGGKPAVREDASWPKIH